MTVQLCTYRVIAKKLETPSTTTLALERIDGQEPKFRAGQYVTVYFRDLNPRLGKEYSISSAPREKELKITVKAIGSYSGRLCAMKVGDTLEATEAQGHFYPHDPHSACLIAGGMGVTPFRSIIIETIGNSQHHDMHLFYSSRYAFDMPFSTELYHLSCRTPSFRLNRFVTRDAAVPADAKSHRMRLEDLFGQMSTRMTREYLVSGSVAFVRDAKKLLLAGGVLPEHILSEICSR